MRSHVCLKMSHISENVRKAILKMVPASIISEISCFVFYDNHPRDQKLIDITICTKNGEVREYYRRDLISSVNLDSFVSKVSELKILRNGNGELLYLIRFNDTVCILSRKEKLRIHQKLNNIERYDISDPVCSGQALLKVVQKDDAVPLVFDDNFENLGDKALLFSKINADESLPILTHLMRKLTEAKYSVKCNEKSHRELLHLRQLAAFSTYQKIHPNMNDSIFKKNIKEITGVLNVKVQTPWVKQCNEIAVLVLNVTNQNNDSIEDVHILLHSSVNSMVYNTKLFEETTAPPFWRENQNQSIEPNRETFVLTVIDLKEIKNSIASPIEFNGVISYMRGEKEYLLPFDNVVLSSLDIMGEEFDVLANTNIDTKTILTIMATSEKTDLILRHIKLDSEENLILPQVLCTYLKMEQVPGTDNIVVHRTSPYHTLHGVMVLRTGVTDQVKFSISLFTRSPSQILALIRYIHDAVPFKILITTQSQTITAKTEQYTNYNEETDTNDPISINYKEYASSILNRTGMLLEYLDNSMIKMHESKDPMIQNKVGREIDLFAGGIGTYKQFRDNMLEETQKAINSLSSESPDNESVVMVVD